MTRASALPADAREVLANTVAAEYAYVTRKGEPLCWPVTPFWYEDRGVLAIATGVSYPAKANHAKRNPKVALLFSDHTESRVPDGPDVLVQGDATVLDSDIQANTDRYIRELRERFAAARIGLNSLTLPLLDFYLPRLWIEVAPVRTTIFRTGGAELIGPTPPNARTSVDTQVRESAAPRLTDSEASEVKARVQEYGEGVVTVVGADGYPQPVRTQIAALADGSLVAREAAGTGPACLTLHHHTLGGLRFKAYMLRGDLEPTSDGYRFVPWRLVGFFGNGLVFPLSGARAARSLRDNLRRELALRGQPMPKLRMPPRR